MKKMSTAQARQTIQRYIRIPGTYGHNIVTMTLVMLAKVEGPAASNALVVELDLPNVFGIYEVWVCPHCGERMESYQADGQNWRGGKLTGLRWWCPPCTRKNLGLEERDGTD